VVRVLASDPAVELIQERGGRLYVWVKKGRCCGAPRTLRASTEAPERAGAFRSVEAGGRFELFVPAGLATLPSELHVELQRFPRRVEAYWDGCAWLV
jgi:hypothetical protein